MKQLDRNMIERKRHYSPLSAFSQKYLFSVVSFLETITPDYRLVVAVSLLRVAGFFLGAIFHELMTKPKPFPNQGRALALLYV